MTSKGEEKIEAGRSANDPKNYAERRSIDERLAWAEALHSARNIRDKNNINILEAFKNFDDVQEYIENCLTSHRYGIEMGMQPTILGACKLVLGISPSKKDLDFLSNLFDKNKLLKNREK